jgi:histidinol dehydrogenase
VAIWLEQSSSDFEQAFAAFLTTKREVSEDVNAVVRDIIEDVRKRGDEALAHYSLKFDGLDFSKISMRVTEAEIDAALAEVDPAVLDALKFAAAADAERRYLRRRYRGRPRFQMDGD